MPPRVDMSVRVRVRVSKGACVVFVWRKKGGKRLVCIAANQSTAQHSTAQHSTGGVVRVCVREGGRCSLALLGLDAAVGVDHAHIKLLGAGQDGHTVLARHSACNLRRKKWEMA